MARCGLMGGQHRGPCRSFQFGIANVATLSSDKLSLSVSKPLVSKEQEEIERQA
jgi:hypothetical protein